jgi:RecB family exonuclease
MTGSMSGSTDSRGTGRSGPGEPGLTLVLGPPNSGKMGYALDWWRERLHLRPVMVAPTGPDVQGLTVEMVRRVGTLVDQSPALTFDGLVGAILGRPLQRLGEFERGLIVSRLLRRTSLRSLGPTAAYPGATTALATLLQLLGESGRTHAELQRILDLWARAEPEVSDLAGDIGRLSEAYADACRALGLIDGPAAVCEAAREAVGWVRPVALYGFTSFTPGQRTLIETLSQQVQTVVTLPYDRSRSVNLSTAAEVGWWEDIAAELVELNPRTLAYSSPVVGYLERHFLSDPPLPEPPAAVTGPVGVRFLLASGQRNEAELVAQQVSTLIREGFPPGGIAVVVRRIRAWSRLLGQVFESCGIPYQIDDRCEFAETGLGHAFLGILRGVARDDAEAVLVFLRGPYSGFAPEAVGDLELSYRRGTARGARALADLTEKLYPGSFAPLWSAVSTAWATSATSGTAVGPRIDVSVLQDLSRRMLAAGVRGLPPGSRDLEEDVRAFRALAGALSTLQRLNAHGDGTGSLEPDGVLSALAGVTVPGSRLEDANAVQILSVQRARARRFLVVAVLGLVEGEFPGQPDTPSLLTAAQRARLDSLGGGGLFTPEADREAALFASAVSRAWQLLLLSARDAEDGGGEAVPSRFWYLAKELLGVDDGEHERRTLADVVYPMEEAPSVGHYLRACAARGLAPHPAIASGPGHVRDRPWRRPSPRLTDPSILRELEASETFSPSSLETYVACPFRWFVERVIGVEELEPGLDGRAIGQLLHDALSATYRKLASAGLLPLRPEGVAEAERLAFGVIAGLVTSGECPGSAAARRLAAWRLKRMARNLFQMESVAGAMLSMSETESTVGGREGIDIGGLKIRGRIDRIDAAIGGTALYVLDYKSGSAPAVAGIGTERALQLPLYLMALAAERPEAEVIGGAYLSPSEERRTGVVMSGSEGLLGSAAEGCRILDPVAADQLYEQTRGIALGAATQIRAGLIAPRPGRDCPSWCDLGPVCRARMGGYRG